MTLTLDIPPDLDPAKRERLAAALADAGLLSPDQAAQLTDATPAESREPPRLRQGSPEWKARLESLWRGRTGVALSIEATSRESIYEDDLR